MKDCATAIFFWVKTMTNADKTVKLGQSVWWTTYYAAGEKCWVIKSNLFHEYLKIVLLHNIATSTEQVLYMWLLFGIRS